MDFYKLFKRATKNIERSKPPPRDEKYILRNLPASLFRVLPDFLIIGAKRAGTTTLWKYLSRHPEIFPSRRKNSKVKELHFFDYKYDYGQLAYRSYFISWLEKLKKKYLQKQKAKCFEATPGYLSSPQVPARVKELLPGAKLIVLLRNPVTRAYSEYQLSRESKPDKNTSFPRLIEKERTIIREHSNGNSNDQSPLRSKSEQTPLIGRGLYYFHLRHWLKYFPRNQLLPIKAELFFSDPEKTLKKILKFLDLQSLSLEEPRPQNQRTYKPMDSEAREDLKDFFRSYNQSLYELLGRNFNWEPELEVK